MPRPERGGNGAILWPDVHRPRTVGAEALDVAHRAVEGVVEPSDEHDGVETARPVEAQVRVGETPIRCRAIALATGEHHDRDPDGHDNRDDPGAVGDVGHRPLTPRDAARARSPLGSPR